MRSGPPANRFIWVGVGVTLVLVALMVLLGTWRDQLRSSQPLPDYGPVADFTLTNQNGQATTLADLRGHAWLADIIFTRCPGPCLSMTRQMRQLQASLPAESTTKLISLTTDPDFDTPAVLKAYAARFGADPQRWLFLTGSKTALARVGRDSLKLAAVEKQPGERSSPDDLFIHSTIFVLVDARGHLRGIFETTGEGIDPAAVQAQILEAVRQLERAT